VTSTNTAPRTVTITALPERILGHHEFRGNVGKAPDYKTRPGERGFSSLTFSVAYQARRKDRDSDEWVDNGDPVWVRCTLWNARADHLHQQGLIQPGLPVIVSGALREAPWIDDEGVLRFGYDLTVDDLSILPGRVASLTLMPKRPYTGPGESGGDNSADPLDGDNPAF